MARFFLLLVQCSSLKFGCFSNLAYSMATNNEDRWVMGWKLLSFVSPSCSHDCFVIFGVVLLKFVACCVSAVIQLSCQHGL